MLLVRLVALFPPYAWCHLVPIIQQIEIKIAKMWKLNSFENDIKHIRSYVQKANVVAQFKSPQGLLISMFNLG